MEVLARAPLRWRRQTCPGTRGLQDAVHIVAGDVAALQALAGSSPASSITKGPEKRTFHGGWAVLRGVASASGRRRDRLDAVEMLRECCGSSQKWRLRVCQLVRQSARVAAPVFPEATVQPSEWSLTSNLSGGGTTPPETTEKTC